MEPSDGAGGQSTSVTMDATELYLKGELEKLKTQWQDVLEPEEISEMRKPIVGVFLPPIVAAWSSGGCRLWNTLIEAPGLTTQTAPGSLLVVSLVSQCDLIACECH